LPIRAGHDSIVVVVAEPDNAEPLPVYEIHSQEQNIRRVERDLQTGQTHYHLTDDIGEFEMPGHGLRTSRTSK